MGSRIIDLALVRLDLVAGEARADGRSAELEYRADTGLSRLRGPRARSRRHTSCRTHRRSDRSRRRIAVIHRLAVGRRVSRRTGRTRPCGSRGSAAPFDSSVSNASLSSARSRVVWEDSMIAGHSASAPISPRSSRWPLIRPEVRIRFSVAYSPPFTVRISRRFRSPQSERMPLSGKNAVGCLANHGRLSDADGCPILFESEWATAAAGSLPPHCQLPTFCFIFAGSCRRSP